MKILLASTASYVPPRGGSTRSNLVWLESLAKNGHECRVVCTGAVSDTRDRAGRVKRELEEQGIDSAPLLAGRDVAEVEYRGLRVFSVHDAARQSAVLKEQVGAFDPDWLLVSSEDLGHVLLHDADAIAPGRVVYLAHTPQFFPFGPASWNPDRKGTDMIRRCAGVIAISRTVADYIYEYTRVRAEIIHPPVYGSSPYPNVGAFDNPYISIINPCAVKGISIFLAIADKHREYQFAALPGWGTTPRDRAALQSLPNVDVMPHLRDINDLFRRSRILLVPSLWLEGFGLVVVEAMLRGVPVIASDYGGLKEAALETAETVHIHPIQQYEPAFDEQRMPSAVVPRENLAPHAIDRWSAALRTLLDDRESYAQASMASRVAALAFVDSLDASTFEQFLKNLPKAAVAPAAAPKQPDLAETIRNLSPEKRTLLLKKLKEQAPKSSDRL